MKITKQTAILILSLSMVLSLALSGAFAGEKPAKTDDASVFDVQVKVEAKDGKSVAIITVTGKNGYHCNTSYPWKLKITPDEKVTVAKPMYKKADAAKFSENIVIFKVPYTAPAGTKVQAVLKLSVCDEKQCQMKKVPLTW